jgi:hypothetical protein
MATYDAVPRRPPTSFFVLLGVIALTTVAAVEGRGLHRGVPLLALIAIATPWISVLTRWRTLLSALFLIILFIPMSKYTLGGGLPFKLEPYRIYVAALAFSWVLATLADPRVRIRRSVLDAPLLTVLGISLLSEIANPSRVKSLFGVVVKGQTFFISFFLVFVLIVSLVRKRNDVEFFVRLLAWGGAVVAFSAIIERRTGYNVFNHLRSFFPLVQFTGGDDQFREGRLRVLASAQHPIALSVLFVILLPLVLYLARAGSRQWLLMAGLYIVAIFSTASRTGIIGLVVLGFVYLALQPRTVLRAWPALLPLLVAVHFAAPGAIGTMRELFNPSTILSSQSDVTVGNDAYGSGRLTDLGPTLSEWSRHPLLGIGYATRIVVGPGTNARLLDDQWLDTLLETGWAGYLAWIWLFGRSVRRLARRASAEGDTPDGWLLTGFAGSIAAFAVTMGFYDALSFVQNVFIFFIIIALAAVLLDDRDEEGEREGAGVGATLAPGSAR